MSRGQFERDGVQKQLKFWVYKIAENELKSFYGRFHNKPNSPGGTTHQNVLANLGSEEDTEEFEAFLVAELLELIKDDFQESTWEAFRRFHFDNLPAADIAETLGGNGDIPVPLAAWSAPTIAILLALGLLLHLEDG